MKLAPTIAVCLNLKSLIAATKKLTILATFAPMVPLPAMSRSQNMQIIL